MVCCKLKKKKHPINRTPIRYIDSTLLVDYTSGQMIIFYVFFHCLYDQSLAGSDNKMLYANIRYVIDFISDTKKFSNTYNIHRRTGLCTAVMKIKQVLPGAVLSDSISFTSLNKSKFKKFSSVMTASFKNYSRSSDENGERGVRPQNCFIQFREFCIELCHWRDSHCRVQAWISSRFGNFAQQYRRLHKLSHVELFDE